MGTTPAWHENEDFWHTMAPVLFGECRWAGAAEQVDQVLALLKINQGARILDLCCGPGRHCLELARRGFAVTGVDRTSAYLDQARQAAAAEDLDIEFVEADAREFSRDGAFDAVLNLFTSFGYFAEPADDQRVLVNACRSLRPGGQLLMEMMGKEVLARMFRERDWVELDDGSIMLEERRLTQDWRHVECRWILVRDGQQKEFTLDLRLYSAGELANSLKQAGFAEIWFYGGLAAAPYDHEAKRLVARGRRA